MKRVVVIASGETERRAIPHLVSHLRDSDIRVDIRIPPGNRPLAVRTVDRIIQASLYEGSPPDKFVVLLDLDGQAPDPVMDPLREGLLERLAGHVVSSVFYAYAQQHLEAWYFADADNLRDYLGRALGNVDSSQPDAISNPKLHLKHLLSRVYTAQISEQIAMRLDHRTIAQRSPSRPTSLK